MEIHIVLSSNLFVFRSKVFLIYKHELVAEAEVLDMFCESNIGKLMQDINSSHSLLTDVLAF